MESVAKEEKGGSKRIVGKNPAGKKRKVLDSDHMHPAPVPQLPAFAHVSAWRREFLCADRKIKEEP